MTNPRYISRVVIVNLAVMSVGATLGFLLFRDVEGKALGWIAVVAAVIGGIANACSGHVFKRVDDIGALQWPDPQVRERLRKTAETSRKVFRTRWLFLWVSWIVCLIFGFLIAFYTGQAAPAWMIALVSGFFLLALYLSIRFAQGFYKLTDQWSELTREKDLLDQRQDLARKIHA